MDREEKIAVLQTILNKLIFDDPKFRSFIKREIGNRKESEAQTNINKEIIRRLRIQNKKLLERIAFQKKQTKEIISHRSSIRVQLSRLSEFNSRLSAALGSCESCWGEDSHCEKCSGKGKTGWKRINKRLFKLYILPALANYEGSVRKASKR